jgi:uncharacterized protein (TIGR03437 family)
MRTASILFFFLFLLPGSVFSKPSRAIASYLQLPDSATPSALAADSAGNLFVASEVTDSAGIARIRVTKTDALGNKLADIDVQANLYTPFIQLALDPSGNIILIGSTILQQSPYTVSGIIVKIDSQLQTVLFSKSLGGTIPLGSITMLAALVLDGDGNIYVTGSTSAADFPVTAGAFQTQFPASALGTTCAFVIEFSSDGKQILFSTFFGGDSTGGDPPLPVTSGSAIALDSAGNIIVGGVTNAIQLPVTPGVFGTSCDPCSSHLSTSFLTKFAGGGAKLLWATYIPMAATSTINTAVSALAIDSEGDIIAAGSASRGFTATTGSLQPAFPQPSGSAGFVFKTNSTAQQILWATYFGGGSSSGVNGLTVDTDGEIWITGTSYLAASLPVPKGTPILGQPYVAGLSSDGKLLTAFFSVPEGGAGLALVDGQDGAKVALGPRDALLTVSPEPGPSLVGLANSASPHVSPIAAFFELVSLYGTGLGPSTAVSAKVVNGQAPTSLGGVQVLFDGVAAQLLYVGPNQINAVVPYRPNSDRSTVQIITPLGPINGLSISNRPSEPEIFLAPVGPGQIEGPAAAINQDGTVNSAKNPAAPESVISVWVSGFGNVANVPVSVVTFQSPLFSYPSLEVLYAGQAPGLVEGVYQINFRLPASGVTMLGIALQVGDAMSDSVFVYVKQWPVALSNFFPVVCPSERREDDVL